MKAICNRGALLDALNLTGNVVAARTPKPVLQCLKLSVENNALTVAATDLEVAIRYRDEQVQIEQPGETLVPADKLRDIVRESIRDYLFVRKFRGLRKAMTAKASRRKVHTDQDVFDRVS